MLVLDDYHLVDDPSIHAALDFFINHLPSNLHVLVASRSEPPLSLARWRASNRLYELRESDLRFTPVEVATFLNETKGLNLSDMSGGRANVGSWFGTPLFRREI